jgi:hypothetical protein
MSGLFGGNTQKQTTSVDLAPEQQQLLATAMPFIEQFANNAPTSYNPRQIAGFNPLQMAGQGAALGSAVGQGGVVGSAADASQFLTSGDALFPGSNPALERTIQAATDPIIERTLEDILPNIRGSAESLGQFSGTRRGLVETGVARDTARQVGDTSARIASEGYGRGLDAMVRGLGLAPQTAQSLSLPASTISAVGDVQQQQEQLGYNEAFNNQMMQEFWPMMIGQQLLGTVGQIPTAGSTTTASQPGTNPIAGALGGASLGTSLFPAMAAAGPVGAGLGALMAFL